MNLLILLALLIIF